MIEVRYPDFTGSVHVSIEPIGKLHIEELAVTVHVVSPDVQVIEDAFVQSEIFVQLSELKTA